MAQVLVSLGIKKGMVVYGQDKLDYLHDIGRAKYVPVIDDEVVNALEYLAKTEGIIPAIESSRAIAYAMKLAKTMNKDKIIEKYGKESPKYVGEYVKSMKDAL